MSPALTSHDLYGALARRLVAALLDAGGGGKLGATLRNELRLTDREWRRFWNRLRKDERVLGLITVRRGPMNNLVFRARDGRAARDWVALEGDDAAWNAEDGEQQASLKTPSSAAR